jgi:hypothetical protein
VGLRPGLDREATGKILCLCRGPNPGRPICSQTPHRLNYPNYQAFDMAVTNLRDPLNRKLVLKM